MTTVPTLIENLGLCIRSHGIMEILNNWLQAIVPLGQAFWRGSMIEVMNQMFQIHSRNIFMIPIEARISILEEVWTDECDFTSKKSGI